MTRPSHCIGCAEWDNKERGECCQLIYENMDKGIIYPLRCDSCGQIEMTCWMAIMPDGWCFCHKLEGIACGGCCNKWNQVLFDEKNYNILEKTEW